MLKDFFWLVGVDELIGVGFQSIGAVIDILACSAKRAFAILPSVLYPVKFDISLRRIKSLADGIFAVGGFGAIHTSAGKQRGEFRNGNAIELVLVNVVDAGSFVGYLGFQPEHQTFGYFPQEHARLAHRVEKRGVFVTPNAVGQEVEYLVCQIGRRKHFVVTQIGKARKHIGVITRLYHLLQVLRNGLTGNRPRV